MKKVIFLIGILLLMGSGQSAFANELNQPEDITFSTVNPCTGREVVVSGQLHTTGVDLLLSGTKAYDPENPGDIFPVVYNYGLRGEESRVFDVTFIIQQPNARYREHQLFQFDQNGTLVRVLVDKVCE